MKKVKLPTAKVTSEFVKRAKKKAKNAFVGAALLVSTIAPLSAQIVNQKRGYLFINREIIIERTYLGNGILMTKYWDIMYYKGKTESNILALKGFVEKGKVNVITETTNSGDIYKQEVFIPLNKDGRFKLNAIVGKEGGKPKVGIGIKINF